MTMMPKTRHSLIVRLQTGDDEVAWDEFVALYRPVIVRVAMARGLQINDAEDLAQQVLVAVAKSIPDWERDPKRARFRTWLGRVVRNATTNALSRRQADRGVGGTTAMQAMNEVAGQSSEHEVFETEWQHEAFRWAADQVRDEFEEPTWHAFWLTAVEGVSATQVARQTGKSVGAIYVAKCRVMQRLQQRVRDLEGNETGSDES